MIVRRLTDLAGTDRDVKTPNWRSRRLLLASDGQAYSLHDTVIYAGTSTEMWYQHHVEAVYCIEGTGTLFDHETGEEHPIEPGMMYLLDGNERHTVRAETQLRMICVFDPAVTGQEVHDETGAYPPPPAASAGSST